MDINQKRIKTFFFLTKLSSIYKTEVVNLITLVVIAAT